MKKIQTLDEKTINRRLFHIACYKDDIKKVNYLFKQGPQDLEHGLAGSCKGGKLEMTRMLIKKGANNHNNALYYACLGGNFDVISLVLKTWDFDWIGKWISATQGACKGGNLSVVKYTIEQGKLDKLTDVEVWNDILSFGCAGGNLEIVELIIDKANFNETDRIGNFDWGLRNACIGKHIEIIKLMFKKGSKAVEHLDVVSFDLQLNTFYSCSASQRYLIAIHNDEIYEYIKNVHLCFIMTLYQIGLPIELCCVSSLFSY